jgi:Squalene-hopene cyclase C-terminal domain
VISLKKTAKAWIERANVPKHARAARRLDRKGLPEFDPGPQRAVIEGLSWLGYAQDHTASPDSGVARHFSLIDGWSSSYPETTGYIVDTLISCGEEMTDQALIQRAKRMLNWLFSIQFPDGAFQGGMVDQIPRVHATFDTGQILIGLAAGTRIDEHFRTSMVRAADWLVKTQDADGCWRTYDTPFAAPGEKVYETHVSIGLFRAAALEPNRGYLEAAVKQVDWALSYQRSNGWFDKCCLTDHSNPLTHTLGYALRGVVEAYLATHSNKYLDAACCTADGLLRAFEPNGRLPGRLDQQWRPAANWVCLTGTSQIAESLLLLSGINARSDYKDVGKMANAFVRRTMIIEGPPEVRGAVKGSFPIDGWYGRWQYLNWACKFMLDANLAEIKLSK